jgi:oligosaccharide repeat unit polymerase
VLGFVVFGSCVATAVIGRLAFGRWLNHVSLYGAVWALSLGGGALQLVSLRPISATAYWFIAAASLAYTSGALLLRRTTLAIAWPRAAGRRPSTLIETFPVPGAVLRLLVTFLSVVAGTAVLIRLARVVAVVGSVSTVFVMSHEVYWLKMQGSLPGGPPYLAAASLTACCLSGAALATHRIGRLWATIPLAVAAALALSTAGRTDVVLAVLLFYFSFEIVRGKTPGIASLRSYLLLLVLVALGIFAAISATRNLGGDEFYRFEALPLSRTSERFSRVATSFYVYAVGPPIVFSEYLAGGGEEAEWGENTLGPLRNGLHRLGFAVKPLADKYQRFYSIPFDMNTGTWLRELRADFGPVGALLVPFVLGAITSVALAHVRYRASLASLIVTSHLFVVAVMSSFMCATRWGSWWASLLIGLAAAGGVAVVEVLRRPAVRTETE